VKGRRDRWDRRGSRESEGRTESGDRRAFQDDLVIRDRRGSRESGDRRGNPDLRGAS